MTSSPPEIEPGFVTARRDLWLHDLPLHCDVLLCGFGNRHWEFTNPYQVTATRDILIDTDAHFVNINTLTAGHNVDIHGDRITNAANVGGVSNTYPTAQYPAAVPTWAATAVPTRKPPASAAPLWPAPTSP